MEIGVKFHFHGFCGILRVSKSKSNVKILDLYKKKIYQNVPKIDFGKSQEKIS